MNLTINHNIEIQKEDKENPYVENNHYREFLTLDEDGNIWIVSEGNGCGDPTMLDEDIIKEIDCEQVRKMIDSAKNAGWTDAAKWLEEHGRTSINYKVSIRFENQTEQEFEAEYDNDQDAIEATKDMIVDGFATMDEKASYCDLDIYKDDGEDANYPNLRGYTCIYSDRLYLCKDGLTDKTWFEQLGDYSVEETESEIILTAEDGRFATFVWEDDCLVWDNGDLDVDDEQFKQIPELVKLEEERTLAGRQNEFRQIADKWHLSNDFLVNILGKSLDTIKTYKYRQLMMPADILVKMRKLDTFLGEMSKI